MSAQDFITKPNIKISPKELTTIRCLDDFDLIMFLSEINDHSAITALNTLKLIVTQMEREKESH